MKPWPLEGAGPRSRASRTPTHVARRCLAAAEPSLTGRARNRGAGMPQPVTRLVELRGGERVLGRFPRSPLREIGREALVVELDRHVDRIELPVDGVTTSALVVQHRTETPEEMVSPGVAVAFVSGNVWGRVDVGYRPGTALEAGARDYAERAIAGFAGVGRRFELVGERGGVRVVDDYAHNPTEIGAALATARALEPRRRRPARAEGHLHQPLPVAQVHEHQAAQVAAPVHPAAQPHLLAVVRGPQLSAPVRAQRRRG